MPCFMFLFFVVITNHINAISNPKSGNQHQINDIIMDLTMLRDLVTTLNTSLQSIQIDKEEKEKEMNATLQAQQQEITQLIGMVQGQQQKINLMESTIKMQQQKERKMNKTIQDQQNKMARMESTLLILEQDNQTLHKDIVFLRENNSAEIEHLKDLNEKGNQNYGAFQLIVQDLVTNVNTLRNRSRQQIGHINDNLTSLARQIHYTSLSFLDAKKILKDLENSTKETNINVSSIFKKLESQGQEMNNLQSGKKTKINMSSIFKKLESQGQEMNNLQSERNRTYAFTVSTSSSLSNFNFKKIVYDKVITNIGGAYNSNTGIFTCPSPGTYVFMWSTMSWSDSQSCQAYIYHNGNQLLLSHSIEQNGGYYEVASNTILLTLTVGDHVWIQTVIGTYCEGYPYTAFSGWKI